MKKARDAITDAGEQLSAGLVMVAMIALCAVVLAAVALGRTRECRSY